MQSYSRLANDLYRKILQADPDFAAMEDALYESREMVCQLGTETSMMLHNRLLDVLSDRHPGPESDRLAGQFRIALETQPAAHLSATVRELEQKLAEDPSDFHTVLRLGMEYALGGRNRRAARLLERVAASGYREKTLAAEFLAAWRKGRDRHDS